MCLVTDGGRYTSGLPARWQQVKCFVVPKFHHQLEVTPAFNRWRSNACVAQTQLIPLAAAAACTAAVRGSNHKMAGVLSC